MHKKNVIVDNRIRRENSEVFVGVDATTTNQQEFVKWQNFSKTILLNILGHKKLAQSSQLQEKLYKVIIFNFSFI